MAGAPIIEIREPGRPVRRVVLDRAIEVGRECDGEVLSDEGASRRHLRLVPSPVALSVVDLGSRNGTLVNGVPITGRMVLEPGAVVRLGSTEIIMIGRANQGRAGRGPQDATCRAGRRARHTAAPSGTGGAAAALAHVEVLGAGARHGAAPGPTAVPDLHRDAQAAPAAGLARDPDRQRAGLPGAVRRAVHPPGGRAVLVLQGDRAPTPDPVLRAPGLWRNICPLAASNQTPRVFGFTRGAHSPGVARAVRRYVIAIVLFLGIASRAWRSSTPTGRPGVLLIRARPRVPRRDRLQGQERLVQQHLPAAAGAAPLRADAVRHRRQHPLPALRRLHQELLRLQPQGRLSGRPVRSRPTWTRDRRSCFVSALPGFVLGFYLVRRPRPASRFPRLYLRAGPVLRGASVGIFYALEALLGLCTTVLIAIWASVAINIFYWFGGVTLSDSFATITGSRRALACAGRSGRSCWSCPSFWIARTYVTSGRYVEQSAGRPAA